jgi:hypothetical protein
MMPTNDAVSGARIAWPIILDHRRPKQGCPNTGGDFFQIHQRNDGDGKNLGAFGGSHPDLAGSRSCPDCGDRWTTIEFNMRHKSARPFREHPHGFLRPFND